MLAPIDGERARLTELQHNVLTRQSELTAAQINLGAQLHCQNDMNDRLVAHAEQTLDNIENFAAVVKTIRAFCDEIGRLQQEQSGDGGQAIGGASEQGDTVLNMAELGDDELYCDHRHLDEQRDAQRRSPSREL